MDELHETLNAMGFYPSEYQLRVGYEYACLKARLQPLLKDIKPQQLLTAPVDHLKRILRVQEKNVFKKKKEVTNPTTASFEDDDNDGKQEGTMR